MKTNNFRPIPGYSNYEISEKEIRNKTTGKTLTVQKNGVIQLISDSGKRVSKSFHSWQEIAGNGLKTPKKGKKTEYKIFAYTLPLKKKDAEILDKFKKIEEKPKPESPIVSLAKEIEAQQSTVMGDIFLVETTKIQLKERVSQLTSSQNKLRDLKEKMTELVK